MKRLREPMDLLSILLSQIYGSKDAGDKGMAELSRRLNEMHGKNINPAPGLFEAIDHNSNSGSAISLGGGMAKMAQMTK